MGLLVEIVQPNRWFVHKDSVSIEKLVSVFAKNFQPWVHSGFFAAFSAEFAASG
jgi:hypothetical protein